MNVFLNLYDYCKYGKITHRTPSGRVIRKKVIPHINKMNQAQDVSTIKTILSPNRKVEKVVENFSRTYNNENSSCQFITETTKAYEDGRFLQSTRPREKEYFIGPFTKRITDHSKPDYDYTIKKLPNGKKEYQIAYPEVTTISKIDGTVTTETKVKRGII